MDSQSTKQATSHRITSEESKGNFSRNTIINVVFFVFNALTSLIMAPYFRQHLGDANYGMTGLARSFTSYTLIITTVFAGTVYRFVTMRLAKDDVEGARSYFNTQLITSVVMALVMLPIVGGLSYFTPSFLRIPPGQEANTQILFALVYLSFLLTLISNPFAVGQFARQRFDIRNLIEIVNQVLQYGTLLVAFALFTPSIWHVGLGYAIGGAFVLLLTVISFKKCLPEIRPALKGFDKAKFKEMVKMGSWLMVSQVGVVLYLTIDLFIINLMLGPTSGGHYNYILPLAAQLRQVSAAMCSMIVPMALANYARQDWDALVKISARAIKFVSIGMAVPIGILCGLATPFITRWLGADLAVLTPLVWLLLPHQIINCGVEPLFGINVASNRVAVPGIVTVLGGIFKVGLSVVLVKYTNLGLYGIALAGLVAFTLKNGIFTPIYAGRILKTSSKPFFTAMAPSALVFAVVSATALGLSNCLYLATYPRLALTGTLLASVAAVGIYFVVLNADDRAFLKSIRKKGRTS